MRFTLFRVLAGLSLATMMLIGAPRAASAHARYDHSDPAGDSVVPTAPTQVQAWFTEGVRSQGSSLQVTDAAGNRVDNNDGQVDLNDPDRKRMFVSLPPLPDGVYTVNWVTVSADDGDQAEGSFRFGVGVNTVLPPLPAGGPVPTISIANTTVNGHEVRLHVNVEGATLGMPASGDMDMSAGGMANMSQDVMNGGAGQPGMAAGGMATAPGALPQGHLHVYVDGVMLQMVYQPDVVLTDVPSGTHQVRVELSNNAHQDWNPPVMATTTVVVP
ncbi:MAG TPA: copper resistance protein CopC [Chloroflexota bacterium]|nr:copper resistance protein CopC [Chloroflexota bacterium]